MSETTASAPSSPDRSTSPCARSLQSSDTMQSSACNRDRRRRQKSTARMSAHVARTASRTGAPVRFISIDGGVTTVAYSHKVKILVTSSGLDWATFVSAWVDGIITDWVPSEMGIVCQGLRAAVEKREGDKASLLELKQWVLQELYVQLMVAWKGDEERVVKAMGGWGDEFAERIVSAASVSILSKRDESEKTEEKESQ